MTSTALHKNKPIKHENSVLYVYCFSFTGYLCQNFPKKYEWTSDQ